MAGKWKIQDKAKVIFAVLKEGFSAVLKGRLLLRLGIDKYFLHIVWLFILITGLIWFNLKVESTLTQVERNKAEIKDIQALHAQKEFEIRELSRRKLLDDLLREKGSKVREPQNPATIIDK